MIFVGVFLLAGMLHTFIRSRGHKPGWPFAVLVAAATLGTLLLAAAGFVIIGLAFVFYAIKSKAEGALGAAFYHIPFTCPECQASVKAARHKEGTAILCPACEEIITVPYDDHSKIPQYVIAEKPPYQGGPVRIQSYTSVSSADLDRFVLEEAGVAATIQNDGTGLNVATSVGLLVASEDWTEARTVLLAAREQPPPQVRPEDEVEAQPDGRGFE